MRFEKYLEWEGRGGNRIDIALESMVVEVERDDDNGGSRGRLDQTSFKG